MTNTEAPVLRTQTSPSPHQQHAPALEFNADVDGGLGRDDDRAAAWQREVTCVAAGDHGVVRQRFAARVLQTHLQASASSRSMKGQHYLTSRANRKHAERLQVRTFACKAK